MSRSVIDASNRHVRIGIVWTASRPTWYCSILRKSCPEHRCSECCMSKISAYVIAYNDEPNMRACLDSVAGWADELIVVDSHSTDGTTKIAHEYTDKVFQHEFKGFGRLRNEAVEHATHDWVFSLDTDER